MFEFSERDAGAPDGLFLERLDTFMDKCLADTKAFSEREYRPFEETRRYVAEWHSRYLFQPPSFAEISARRDTPSKVRSILCEASRILESLYEVSGIQSFLLAVDPNNPSDGGFLGGSVVGREFWRGMRGGGEAGAKAFKAHCLRELESNPPPITFPETQEIPSRSSSAPAKQAPAKSVKNVLYEHVRTALRTASGIRSAEMKWTNPERLDMYGVRLVGWPVSIPAQNPSSLKLPQNKQLLECLQNGTMRFEKSLITPGPVDGLGASSADATNNSEAAEAIDDFSWAYDADGGGPSVDLQDSRNQRTWSTSTLDFRDTMSVADSRSDFSARSWTSRCASTPPPSRKRPRSSTDVTGT